MYPVFQVIGTIAISIICIFVLFYKKEIKAVSDDDDKVVGIFCKTGGAVMVKYHHYKTQRLFLYWFYWVYYLFLRDVMNWVSFRQEYILTNLECWRMQRH